MPIVAIRLAGKTYQVACGEGEEERLHQLAQEVQDRINTLEFNMKNKPGEVMSLLLSALMLADELSEKQKEIDDLRANPAASIDDGRMARMEAAMIATMEEIASRVEKMAERVEIH